MAFGHKLTYCRSQFGCLFCARRHPSSESQSNKKPNFIPTCANFAGSHKATSLDFPRSKTTEAIATSQPAAPTRHRLASIPVVPGVSYVSAAFSKNAGAAITAPPYSTPRGSSSPPAQAQQQNLSSLEGIAQALVTQTDALLALQSALLPFLNT